MQGGSSSGEVGVWPSKSDRTVVQATWRAVNQAGVEALERLLSHFLDANPHLRPFFVSDRHQHARKMFIFMNKIVEQLAKPEELVPELEALARRHLAYHATKDDYLRMKESLQWLLAHYLGGQLNDEIKSAWSNTYEALCTIMQRAVDEYVAANGGEESFVVTNGKPAEAAKSNVGAKENGSRSAEGDDGDEPELVELTPEEVILIRETWAHIRSVTDGNGNEFDLLRIHVKEKFPEKKKYCQCPELKKLYEKQQREKSAASFLSQLLGHACEQIKQSPPPWAALQEHFARLGKSHTSSALPEVQEFGKVVMQMIDEALGNLYTQQASDAWDKLVRMVLEWFVLGASEKRKKIFFSPLLKRSNSIPERPSSPSKDGSGSVPTHKRSGSTRS